MKLDIFTIIDTHTLSAGAMAEKMGMDARGITMLLDTLAALALLTKNRSGYANTPAPLDYLSRNLDRYIGYMIQHHRHLADSWVLMDQAMTESLDLSGCTRLLDMGGRSRYLCHPFLPGQPGPDRGGG